jgi:hypothetical protein
LQRERIFALKIAKLREKIPSLFGNELMGLFSEQNITFGNKQMGLWAYARTKYKKAKF